MAQALIPANRQPGAQPAAIDDEPFLIFRSGGGEFGLGILAIKEIIQFGQLTDVPLMPTEVRGVINLRGAVVPVIDLAVRFGRPPAQIGRRSCIVIVDNPRIDDRQDLGVLVDAVVEVVEIAAPAIEPAPAFGNAVRSDFLRGMGKVGGKLVALLNPARVLAFDELLAPSAEAQGA